MGVLEENSVGINTEQLATIIKKGNKQLEKARSTKFRSDVSFDYDQEVREEFRRKFPEKVEKIKSKIIRKSPYLKYHPDLLRRKIDQKIFPDVLEKQDKYIYFDKEQKKTGGGTHLSIYEVLNNMGRQGKTIMEILEILPNGGRKKMLIQDMLDILLEELTLEENTILKMTYGLGPYIEEEQLDITDEQASDKEYMDTFTLKEREMTYKSIGEKLGIPSLIVSKIAKQALAKMLKRSITISDGREDLEGIIEEQYKILEKEVG